MSFTCVSGRPDDDSHGFVAAAETVLNAPSGTFIHNDHAGDLSLTLYTVKSVSIANLADVAEYKITRDAVAVTHWVRLAFQAAAKLGHNQSLFTLRSIFFTGSIRRAKDEVRAACYKRLSDESDEDKTKKFPNINIVCPLPPQKMPGT